MIPLDTPTNPFSARCAMRATWSRGTSRCRNAASAVAVATPTFTLDPSDQPDDRLALIVAVVLFIIAAVLALLGKKKLQQAGSPVPEHAVENVKADIAEVKEARNREH